MIPEEIKRKFKRLEKYILILRNQIANGGGGEGGPLDSTPTNGSSNGVTSNGVFDSLALKADDSSLSSHVQNTTNPHNTTKAQIGLGNVPDVDATQRANHIGTQAATTITQDATHRFVTDTEKTLWNSSLYFDPDTIDGDGTFANPIRAKGGSYDAYLAADFPTANTTATATGLISPPLPVGVYSLDILVHTSATNVAGVKIQLTTTGSITGRYRNFVRTSNSSTHTSGTSATFNALGNAFNTEVGNSWANYKGRVIVTVAGATIGVSVAAVAGTATVLALSDIILLKK